MRNSSSTTRCNDDLSIQWKLITKNDFNVTMLHSVISIRVFRISKWPKLFFLSANAVQAMVSKDIVHRDLKPQNILMNHEGRSVKNPQPQDIRLKIGKISMKDFLFEWLC